VKEHPARRPIEALRATIQRESERSNSVSPGIASVLPRLYSTTISTERLLFDFRDLATNSKFCLTKLDINQTQVLLDTFAVFFSKQPTVAEVFPPLDAERWALPRHERKKYIGNGIFLPLARSCKRLNFSIREELQFNDVIEEVGFAEATFLAEITISKRMRVLGYLRGNRFHTRWFDPTHAIWNSSPICKGPCDDCTFGARHS
jgi:hypothetical protein